MAFTRFLTALLFSSALGATSFAAVVRGTVFEDRNGNGTRDGGEYGIANVQVSDGATIVETDAEGNYELNATDHALVFVIKPRGWSVPLSPTKRPRFYASPSTGGMTDFALTKREEPDRFRVLLLTDPQPVSPKELDYFDRTFAQKLAGTKDFAFAVTLGDIVYDRPELYLPFDDSMAKVGIPSYNIIGNHDLNLGATRERDAMASFELRYGPTTYAFHYGGALFVALNDVRILGGMRYMGGLRDDQFAFLTALLRSTPVDEPIVVMMHIPWFYPNPTNAETFRKADRARLFAALQDRPHVLFLSGHTHYQRHYFYGADDDWHGAKPLEDYNVAAACGSYWGGPPDNSGIPLATMSDGTPNGYGILTIAGTTMRTEYRAARLPADYQIGLHAPVAIKRSAGYISYYANVFNAHEGWTVESRIDDHPWNPMRRVIDWDPSYAKMYLDQDTMGTPLATPRLPDPTVCYHLWRNYFPPDLGAGAHVIEVRATDPTGAVCKATQGVQVVELAK